jgi:hypothetical protein
MSSLSGFVAGRAVCVVSAPSLAFSDRVVAAREPVRVQAVDEGVVGRLAGLWEGEGDVPRAGPEIEVPGHERAALTERA